MRFPRLATDLKSREFDAANKTFGRAGSVATATSACEPRTCETSTSSKDAPAATVASAKTARSIAVAGTALTRSP